MFEQVKLSYGFDALEPQIDTLTMETHYGKHHAAYTKNFNDLASQVPAFEGKSAKEILMNVQLAPESLRQGIINNGGGYYNHNLYFESMTPGGKAPSGKLADMIIAEFGSLVALQEKLHAAAMGQFGSGWAWLILEGEKLKVVVSANQNSPLNEGNPNLLLPVDVWEHAYYLKYKNLRADHINAYFEVIDWDVVAKRLDKAL